MLYYLFIINKAGSLIYYIDLHASQSSRAQPGPDIERIYTYPLPFILKKEDNRIIVSFGESDGVRVGHAVLSINGVPAAVSGRKLEGVPSDSNWPAGLDIFELLTTPANFEHGGARGLSIRFGRPRLSANERITLASMMHSLNALAAQVSPVPDSGPIEMLETDTFKINAYRTPTGLSLLVVSDPRQPASGCEQLLRRIHELYVDYALKNPFHPLDMPVRSELFDVSVRHVMDSTERTGTPL